MSKDTKIILYAMVKNEENVIERMFESCLPLISGAFFLDTGSADRTLEIIENLKSKHPELLISYEKTEFVNFVETRNYGFSYVNDIFSDFDYILTMDADEFWIGNTSDVLGYVYENNGANSFDVKIKESGGTMYNRTRFIHIDDENNKWRFSGPGAHEYITNKVNGLLPQTNFTINSNYGVFHDHPEGKDYQKKFELESRLLTEFIKHSPETANDYPRALFYLANTYRDWLKFDLALGNYIKYVMLIYSFKASGRWFFVDELYDALLKIAEIYTNSNDLDKAIEFYDKAIECCRYSRREAYIYKAVLLERNSEYFINNVAYKYYNKNGLENSIVSLIHTIDSINMNPEEIYLWFSAEFVWNYFYLWATVYLSERGNRHLNSIAKIMKNWKRNYYDNKLVENQSVDTINNLHNLEWILKETSEFSKTEKYQSIDRYFDKIFVLNLEYRKDRWEDMKFRLKTCGIDNYERFDAYNGALMNPLKDDNITLRRSGNYLACTLSHLEMIDRARRNDWEKILVLEDDIKIHKNANEIFSKIINEVEETYPDWDILYFGHIPFLDGNQIFQPNTKDRLLYCTAQEKIWAWGLFGYAISKKMYSTLLDHYANNFTEEFDKFLTSKIQQDSRYKCIVTFPQIFAHTQSFSDNEGIISHNGDAWINKTFSDVYDYIE